MDNRLGDAYYPGLPDQSASHPKIGEHPFLSCFCEGHYCPPGILGVNGTCQAKPGAKCFSAVEEVLDLETGLRVPHRTYGCLPHDDNGGLFQCKGNLVPHLNPKSIACCSDSNLCNLHLTPMYESSPLEEDDGFNSFTASLGNTEYLILLIVICICLVIFVIFIAVVYLKQKKCEDKKQKYILAATSDPEYYIQNFPGTLNDLREQTSGSGSGLPLLTQRTITRQIEMEKPIGRGRYGEVWLANWRGEKIAVKSFLSIDEASWVRETDIYQTVWLRHENILGFLAADIKGSSAQTKLLLLTDYHERGSLYDYLNNNVLNSEGMLRMCYSIISGISHLHTEIYGSRGKPAIAHRDIKSRNILVKNDATCAIADFGLAVRYDSGQNKIDIQGENPRVGTIRYMSPESLDKSLNFSNFSAFLSSDMYSVGLVFWEIARRTVTGEKVVSANEYKLPYFEYVNPDPSFEEMQNVVCLKGIRPTLYPRWTACSTLSDVSVIMSECWKSNPSARLSALRVKKSISDIMHRDISFDGIKIV